MMRRRNGKSSYSLLDLAQESLELKNECELKFYSFEIEDKISLTSRERPGQTHLAETSFSEKHEHQDGLHHEAG